MSEKKYLVSIQDLHTWWFHELPVMKNDEFDEWLKAREFEERICTIKESSGYDELLESWFWHLSCGHMSEESVVPPRYCPNCGAKVVS